MVFRDEGWPPYVPVAQRCLQAERQVARLRKKGRAVDPVAAGERGALTATFWGKAWCRNLERYSDRASRLPRGRSYLRGGAVIDLQIGPGRVDALVHGSELYEVALDIVWHLGQQWIDGGGADVADDERVAIRCLLCGVIHADRPCRAGFAFDDDGLAP